MMRLKLAFILVVSGWCMKGYSQVDSLNKGIIFEKSLNWSELKKKAKTEKKFILIDCFTSWCMPCKQMEKLIYPQAKVGDFINRNFITVKVQFDSDKRNSKSMYDFAKSLETSYSVNAFPTFLFFGPDGKIVHRSAGGYSANGFISLAKDAMDTTKQYYKVMTKYDPSKMNIEKMKALALSYKTSGPEFASKIIVDIYKRLNKNEVYLDSTLDFFQGFSDLADARIIAVKIVRSASVEEFNKRSFLQFMVTFVKNSSDDGFKYLVGYPQKVDSILNDRYFSTRGFICNILYEEKVKEYLEKSLEIHYTPFWDSLIGPLRKYGDYYADRVKMESQIIWFNKVGNKPAYKAMLIEYVEKYSNDLDDWYLNDYAWSLFNNSQSDLDLEVALKWSDKAIKMNPGANWIDTYANILYKLGRIQLAMQWERISVQLEPDNSSYKNNLSKMEAGIPTWKVENIK